MKNMKSLALFFGLVLLVMMGQTGCPFFGSPSEDTNMDYLTGDDGMMDNEDDGMADDEMGDDDMDDDTSMETEGMMAEGTPEDELDDDMIDDTDTDEETEADAGVYTAYDPALVGSNENVVLFFHAPWCPDCVATDAEITANLDTLPENLTVLKVDYDSSTELKTQYGVTYQHTFVEVDANGEKVNMWNGGDLDMIIENAV